MKPYFIIVALLAAGATSGVRARTYNQYDQETVFVSIKQLSVGEKSIEISLSIVNVSNESIRTGEMNIRSVFQGLTVQINNAIVAAQPFDQDVRLDKTAREGNIILVPQEKREFKLECHGFVPIPMESKKDYPLKANGDYVLNSGCFVITNEGFMRFYKVFGAGRAKVKSEQPKRQSE